MTDMFGGVAAADVQLRIPPYEPWPAATRLQREYDAVGFFLSGHPLDEYGDLLKKLQGADLGRVLPVGQGRQLRRPRCRDRPRPARSGAPRPATRWASSCSRTRPAISRRSSSPKACSAIATSSSPAGPSSLILQAGLEGEDVRARIQMAEPLDEAVAKHQKGMRIFLRDERPIGSVQERLKVRGEGEVSLGPHPRRWRPRGRGQASGHVSGLAADRGRAAGGPGRGRRPDESEPGYPTREVFFSTPGRSSSSSSGLARGSTPARAAIKDVDGRDKPGHDVNRGFSRLAKPLAIARLFPYRPAHPTRGACLMP